MPPGGGRTMRGPEPGPAGGAGGAARAREEPAYNGASGVGARLGDAKGGCTEGVGLGGQADCRTGGQQHAPDDHQPPDRPAVRPTVPHAASRASTANDITSCSRIPASSVNVLVLRARSASSA